MFLLEWTLTVDTNLPSQHTTLLPKLPLMDLYNALSMVMVYHTALLLTKELTSHSKSSVAMGPGSWSSLVLSCSLPS